MALLLKVDWVEQSADENARDRVRRIGGWSGKFQWQHTRAQAIEGIEQGVFQYYVQHGDSVLKLEIAQAADGNKYLKTTGNADFLLSLPGPPTRHNT